MQSEKSYRVFVDTGGTFTDLIAIDNYGGVKRKKILSKGTIRGVVAEWISQDKIKVRENWGLERDILAGFQFRLMTGEDHPGVKVVHYDIKEKILTLESAIRRKFTRAGLSFELSAGEEAPVLATRMLTGTALKEDFPVLQMRLGSTKGTNALLEHKGARSVLFITKGFKDLLEIGTQQRPDIFSLNIKKRQPLPSTIIEVDERIDTNGRVLKELILNDYSAIVAELKKSGIQSASVVFLNAYRNNKHEQIFSNFLEKSGINYISVSTELSPLIKILERAETTAVNAYLSPVIHEYINGITAKVGENLLVMNSAGGLVKAYSFHPKDSLLSGPAGGVVGASEIGKKAGFDRLITFDMGGTSTDVSRYHNEYDYKFELEIGDAHIFSPAIAIETVAAGGGSVCYFDGFKLMVGPESAGADPGPACYGAGGPLALTDVNLLLGRMDVSKFGIPVNSESPEIRLKELEAAIEQATSEKPKKEEILSGFLDIANEIMAGAIKKISTSKGFDPADYVLVAFGGAGGMHACSIARLLNMKKIIVPADAGLLSAYGIGSAKIERFAERQVLKLLDNCKNDLGHVFDELLQQSLKTLEDEMNHKIESADEVKTIFLRFKGQDSVIPVVWIGDQEQLIQVFKTEYVKLFGHWVENREVEVESVRLKLSVGKNQSEFGNKYQKTTSTPDSSGKLRSWVGRAWIDTSVYDRNKLLPGHQMDGFAIITDDKSTTVVEEGWTLEVDEYLNLIISISQDKQGKKDSASQTQETKLELFTNRFMSVAANMGAILQRTALSVNIKERLDFSCALLDAEGYLVANAPHIPVHLGSLGICVRTLLEHFTFEKGDTIVTNHPFYGGSHLPDVTLVTPIFSEQNERLGFVVNRAHHAEIGGISPGSMPPSATNLAEEGVTISPFYLAKKGKVNWTGMKEILKNAPYPSRMLKENMADLNAALASNLEGLKTFLRLVDDYGLKEVKLYMKLLKEHAAHKMRKVLTGFDDGEYTATEFLDDGTPVKVNITINRGQAKVDFTGSGPVHPRNMNATPAIVNSVVIYVMRLLLNEEIPLNDGLMEPVELIIPEGFLNPRFDRSPEECPAVVGGNVEVSQRLTDTLLKAFGVAACSQGTMNNVLFGNQNFGYYETVCGGTGATNLFAGASAVHQHMTNTRITDPEILEHRYPVRLNCFEVRKGSGGEGARKGGDGVIREYTFLEDIELSLLSQHRQEKPFGLSGGKPGQTGSQKIVKPDGSEIEFNGVDHIKLEKGDTFVLETPGGGGFGKPKNSRQSPVGS